MQYLEKIDSALARVETFLAVLLLGVMVLLTSIQVFLRILSFHLHLGYANALLREFDWSQPLAKLLVLWVTFIGASMVTRDDRHIRINILDALLHSKLAGMRVIVMSAVSLAISLFLLRASIGYLWTEVSYGDVLFLGIPAWTGHLIVSVGFGAISLRFFIRLVETLYRHPQLP